MTDEQLIEKVRGDNNLSSMGRCRLAKELEITENKARSIIRLSRSDFEVINKKTNMKGISMDELRSKIDNVFIVRQNALKLEKNYFLTQPEFVQLCGFSNVGYKVAIEHPEFSKYRGKAGSVIYWGHPDSILELKSEGHLKDC